jgi:hypothetical protein
LGGIRRAIGVAVLVASAVVSASCGADRQQHQGGKFLVYTRHVNSDAQAVWIAHVDGSHRRLLVRQGLFGAVSPDGRWVAFNKCLGRRERCALGDTPFALFLVSTSGGKSRLLARATTYPSWSPTSDRIVGLRKNILVSVDLDGKITQLEKSPAIAGWSFSPDGKWIVYAEARQHTKCGSDLFIVPASGGEERRLTHGRDVFPVWGRHWIAFSRYPTSCAYARRIWRVRPDAGGEQPVTPPPAPRYARNGYYGLDPIDWTADETVLLGGLATEWGPEAIRVEVGTGAFHKLSGYALDLSSDGRFALVDSGGSEGVQEIASVRLSDGRRRLLARGDVAFPSWNR